MRSLFGTSTRNRRIDAVPVAVSATVTAEAVDALENMLDAPVPMAVAMIAPADVARKLRLERAEDRSSMNVFLSPEELDRTKTSCDSSDAFSTQEATGQSRPR
ncbi:hypothetical protein GCM10010464_32440 [Pseudonocardia yunnanensis]